MIIDTGVCMTCGKNFYGEPANVAARLEEAERRLRIISELVTKEGISYAPASGELAKNIALEYFLFRDNGALDGEVAPVSPEPPDLANEWVKAYSSDESHYHQGVLDLGEMVEAYHRERGRKDAGDESAERHRPSKPNNDGSSPSAHSSLRDTGPECGLNLSAPVGAKPEPDEEEREQSEFLELLHSLWGQWRDGAAYSQVIKDKWGRLLFLIQKRNSAAQSLSSPEPARTITRLKAPTLEEVKATISKLLMAIPEEIAAELEYALEQCRVIETFQRDTGPECGLNLSAPVGAKPEPMMADFLPCPFCGGTPILESLLQSSDYTYNYRCRSCAAQGPWTRTEGGAKHLWNMRVDSAGNVNHAAQSLSSPTQPQPIREEAEKLILALIDKKTDRVIVIQEAQRAMLRWRMGEAGSPVQPVGSKESRNDNR